MHFAVHDLAFPSALAGKNKPRGVLFSTVEESRLHQYIQHPKVVFLEQLDHTEIQRAATNKLPVLLKVHSLPSAFDTLKLNGVKMLLVCPEHGKPLIDYGWMQKAREEEKSVVFSLTHIQSSLNKKDIPALQEYRKLSKLLEKSHIPFGVASFAKTQEDLLSAREMNALAGYLGVKKFDLEWVQ